MKCQRCGGDLYREGEALYCYLCSAEHTLGGYWKKPRLVLTGEIKPQKCERHHNIRVRC